MAFLRIYELCLRNFLPIFCGLHVSARARPPLRGPRPAGRNAASQTLISFPALERTHALLASILIQNSLAEKAPPLKAPHVQ